MRTDEQTVGTWVKGGGGANKWAGQGRFKTRRIALWSDSPSQFITATTALELTSPLPVGVGDVLRGGVGCDFIAVLHKLNRGAVQHHEAFPRYYICLRQHHHIKLSALFRRTRDIEPQGFRLHNFPESKVSIRSMIQEVIGDEALSCQKKGGR